MCRFGIHFVSAVFVVLCLSSISWGQMQKGDTLLDLGGGMALRIYNDYDLKFAHIEARRELGYAPKYSWRDHL